MMTETNKRTQSFLDNYLIWYAIKWSEIILIGARGISDLSNDENIAVANQKPISQ